jgi:hypothetical protein
LRRSDGGLRCGASIPQDHTMIDVTSMILQLATTALLVAGLIWIVRQI